MTVSSTVRKAGPFSGNGVTTVFSFTFKVFNPSDVRVVQTDPSGVESDLTVGFTIALHPDQDASPGGTVTFSSAPANGYKITLASQVLALQQTDLTGSGAFYPDVIEAALDRAVILLQQIAESVSRAITAPISGAGGGSLPSPSASNLIGWNASADGLQNYPPSDPSAFSAALGASTGSGLLGHIGALTGSVFRLVRDRLRDFVTVKDFGAKLDGVTNDAAAMTASAVAGTVVIPAGSYSLAALPSSYPNTTYVYDGTTTVGVYFEAPESSRTARRAQIAQIAGSHNGAEISGQYFGIRPSGSGTNGPTSADYGVTVSAVKRGWPTATTAGEIDGINVVVRNCSSGSGYQADAGGILVNVANVGAGYAVAVETQTSLIDTSGATIRQISTQIGVVDPVAGNYNGFYVQPSIISGTCAYMADSTATVGWTNFVQFFKSQSGARSAALTIDGAGQIEMFDVVAGQTASRVLRVANGSLAVLNAAKSGTVLSIDDSGNISINGVKVVGSRETGWTAGTGTPNKGAFAADTATAAQAAQRVLALEQALRAHGLIN